MYLWCPGKHDPMLYPASKPLWWFWIFPNASELVDTWDYQSTFIYIYIYILNRKGRERERERERLLGRFHLCDWSMFWWKRIHNCNKRTWWHMQAVHAPSIIYGPNAPSLISWQTWCIGKHEQCIEPPSPFGGFEFCQMHQN